MIAALTAAFYAGDGAVSTIGDILRATAAVVPRGREGIDPQFLSTLAQDCISRSMLKVLVAKGDAMTADAAQTPGDSGGRGSGGRGGDGRGGGGARGSGAPGGGARGGGGVAALGKRVSRSSYADLLNLCPERCLQPLPPTPPHSGEGVGRLRSPGRPHPPRVCAAGRVPTRGSATSMTLSKTRRAIAPRRR